MKDSESSKRTDELDISKIELAIRMLYRTITHMFAVDYVLCDSWFTYQSHPNYSPLLQDEIAV